MNSMLTPCHFGERPTNTVENSAKANTASIAQGTSKKSSPQVVSTRQGIKRRTLFFVISVLWESVEWAAAIWLSLVIVRELLTLVG